MPGYGKPLKLLVPRIIGNDYLAERGTRTSGGDTAYMLNICLMRIGNNLRDETD